MHSKRWLSALFFLPLFILLIFKGGVFPFWLLVTAAALTGLREFYGLWANKLAPAYKMPGMVLGGALCLSFGGYLPGELSFWATLSGILILMHPLKWMRKAGQVISSKLLVSLSGTLFGLFYVVWLLGHLIWLRRLPMGREAVFVVFLITFGSDTAAYYVGSALGRHRLAVEISPKKSIEGAIGGLIGTMAASYIGARWFYPMPLKHVIILGVILGICAQAGDLCESLIKRGAEVKDSGGLIPGHGGLLDRLDSLLFTIPCFYYYLKLVLL